MYSSHFFSCIYKIFSPSSLLFPLFLSLASDLFHKPLHKSEYPFKGFSLFILFMADFLRPLYFCFLKSPHIMLFFPFLANCAHICLPTQFFPIFYQIRPRWIKFCRKCWDEFSWKISSILQTNISKMTIRVPACVSFYFDTLIFSWVNGSIEVFVYKENSLDKMHVFSYKLLYEGCIKRYCKYFFLEPG